jgi:hypothetical protein
MRRLELQAGAPRWQGGRHVWSTNDAMRHAERSSRSKPSAPTNARSPTGRLDVPRLEAHSAPGAGTRVRAPCRSSCRTDERRLAARVARPRRATRPGHLRVARMGAYRSARSRS